jgi:hypothetical protein
MFFNDIKRLEAGSYIVYIQPHWKTVDHPDFMKVLADIYSSRVLQMGEIDWMVGFESIVDAVKIKL